MYLTINLTQILNKHMLALNRSNKGYLNSEDMMTHTVLESKVHTSIFTKKCTKIDVCALAS